MRPNDIMAGFDVRFETPEQYIVDITHEIWEQGGIGLIESAYYADPCPVYTPLGVSRAARDVTTGTQATLTEFPDRQLLADDIIIGQKSHGFYSSHRVRSTATHLGPGRFCPLGRSPSGRSVGMLTIADCVCRDNRIVEEWLVRDQAGMARQVGLDPKVLGAEIGRNSRAGAAPGCDALVARWAGQDKQTVEGEAALAARAVAAMTDVWADASMAAVKRHYDRAVRLEAPGGDTLYGVHQVERLIGDIRGAIPDGCLHIHHVIARRDIDRPKRVALRWSYAGRHAGAGRYGMPTLVPLALLGITHLEFVGEQIKSEWMLLDELSVWAQIAGARG